VISTRLTVLVATLAVLVASGVHAQEPSAPPAPSAWGPKIMHLPVQERRVEQGILRPIPISVELPGEIAWNASRVLVSYRLWGEPGWITIQLRAVGQHYEGAIPCLEVSTVTGDFRYYIRVHDAHGRVIAQGASRASPYVVTIKHDTMLASAPAHAKCPDPTSCPPGFPGCPSEVVDVVCESDSDCEEGTECNAHGICAPALKKNRFTLSMSQDFGVVATSGACSVASQESEGYGCLRADGARYAGTPVLTNEPLQTARGNTRIVAGYDRLVSDNTSLGVRVGWSLLGEGPTAPGGASFVPFSASARATHWFGQDPFAQRWLRPYAFVAGGYAMFDLETHTHVREDPTAPSHQSGNDLEQTVTLWKRAGDGFIGAGAGLTFVFAPRSESFVEGAFVELAVSQSFPYGATIVTPSVGLHVLP
jgi:hypothetical protein